MVEQWLRHEVSYEYLVKFNQKFVVLIHDKTCKWLLNTVQFTLFLHQTLVSTRQAARGPVIERVSDSDSESWQTVPHAIIMNLCNYSFFSCFFFNTLLARCRRWHSTSLGIYSLNLRAGYGRAHGILRGGWTAFPGWRRRVGLPEILRA